MDLSNVRALARAATEVENRTAAGLALVGELRERAERALVVGITGSPGAGKSTLLDQLVACARGRGMTVAVIAVDPSSPYTGGAILGDRVRMQRHSGDDGVFIRSMASRGSLGGVAAATQDMITLFAGAGRDVVLVETVGVGQAETEIVRLAQVVVVVMAPSMGDDIQAMKAGVLEIADLFAVNKADLPGAAQLEGELHEWGVPVLRVTATNGTGVEALFAAILERAKEKEAE